MHWVIGDIHGMLGPLESVLEAVHRADGSAQVYFTGDYVNRGPESRRVIELLLSLSGARFLRGNHDDIFGQVLYGQTYCPNASRGRRLVAFQWFMQFGLESTLRSYGVDGGDLARLMHRPSVRALDSALACVPESHRRFIRGLEAVIEEDDFYVGHGKWEPEKADNPLSIAQQLAEEGSSRYAMLWGRFRSEEITGPKAWHRTGYFGHTSVECYPELQSGDGPVPICGPRAVLLDTGAALSPGGRLTAFCHETQRCVQASHFGEMIGPG